MTVSMIIKERNKRKRSRVRSDALIDTDLLPKSEARCTVSGTYRSIDGPH